MYPATNSIIPSSVILPLDGLKYLEQLDSIRTPSKPLFRNEPTWIESSGPGTDKHALSLPPSGWMATERVAVSPGVLLIFTFGSSMSIDLNLGVCQEPQISFTLSSTWWDQWKLKPKAHGWSHPFKLHVTYLDRPTDPATVCANQRVFRWGDIHPLKELNTLGVRGSWLKASWTNIRPHINVQVVTFLDKWWKYSLLISNAKSITSPEQYSEWSVQKCGSNVSMCDSWW